MTAGDWVPWISPVVTLIIGVLVYLNARRQNRTGEKQLTVEEQRVEDARAEMIANMTGEELKRLYTERIPELEASVERLQKTVADLQKADTEKQKTINDQADELERTRDELRWTNQVLTDVRALVSSFAGRVEEAWTSGHTMPTLTPDEWALLNDTIPKTTFLNRGATS